MPGPSAITRDDLETLTKLYVYFTNRSISGDGMFVRNRAKTTADEITTLMMEIQVNGDWE